MLEVCLEMLCFFINGDGIVCIFEGLLLEIICYMVFFGIGVIVLLCVFIFDIDMCEGMVCYVFFVVLVFLCCVVIVWCKSFMW